jgi:DNA-binding MarR family transcriptional regulator
MVKAPIAPENVPCAAGTLRRASRSLARFYDGQLAHAGLTTTQFSVLRTLQRRGGRAQLAELADELVFERTSLYRALGPLRRAGLIAVRPGADRRAKDILLTARAARRIATAMPYWIDAQHTILDRIGVESWDDLVARIGQLTALARAHHS